MKPSLQAGSKYSDQFRGTIQSANAIVIVASPATVLGRKLAELRLEVSEHYLGEEVCKPGNRLKNWPCIAEKPERDKGVIGIFLRNE